MQLVERVFTCDQPESFIGPMRQQRNAVLLAILLVLGSSLNGCFEENVTEAPIAALTRIHLTAAGFPNDLVDRVEVYVTEVSASTVADTSAADRTWLTIAKPERRFELLSLGQGETVLLGEGGLPPGEYRAVRLTLDASLSLVVYGDGRVADVLWPASNEFIIGARVEGVLGVSDAGAEIVIDLNLARSFLNQTFSPVHDIVFAPFLRAVEVSMTGGLTGKVWGDPDGDGRKEPLEHAMVTVFRGERGQSREDWQIVTGGGTDRDGRYRVAFLPVGSYVVHASPPQGVPLGSITRHDVPIRRGQQTDFSLTLPPLAATSLTIEGARTVAVGGTLVLRALVWEAEGVPVDNPSITWNTSAPEVATVSGQGEYGQVFGVDRGTATISAHALGRTDSITIAVGGGNTPAFGFRSTLPR